MSEDGRKYWYNQATRQSVIKKPICLKTPEERAIADCIWAEFTHADGRKYYSAEGKTSVWVMPEEYRVWRQQMDAVEAKKAADLAAKKAGGAAPGNGQAPAAGAEGRGDGAAAGTGAATTSAAPADKDAAPESRRSAKEAKEAARMEPLLTFASKADAIEAFKVLMKERDVSTVLKMKDVGTLLIKDHKWLSVNAALNAGEKNQALAEYQTARAKEEKVQKKIQDKRNRDAFYTLLAEKVEIQAGTRWREAMEILKDDNRYKQLEDPAEREELFAEWIDVLDKKQREDRIKAREDARKGTDALLESLAAQGRLSRKSTWAEVRTVVMEAYQKHAQESNLPRIALLDDTDMKRLVQDFIASLEARFKEELRKRKDAAMAQVRGKMDSFQEFLEQWAATTNLALDTRWREVVSVEEVKGAPEYTELVAVLGEHSSLLGSAAGEPRDVYERVVAKLKDTFKRDRRLVRDALVALEIIVSHDTALEEVQGLLRAFAESDSEQASWLGTVLQGAAARKSKGKVEEGEEAEADRGSGSFKESVLRDLHKDLRALLQARPAAATMAFDELRKAAVQDYEDAKRRRARREERFTHLLQDTYYRSDHITATWEDAKAKLQHCSAYEALSREDRKRLFVEHMAELQRRLDGLKNKASAPATGAAKSASEAKPDREEGEEVPAPAPASGDKGANGTKDAEAKPEEVKVDRKVNIFLPQDLSLCFFTY